MKAKNLFIIMIFLFIGSIFTEVAAQKNLEALITRCETETTTRGGIQTTVIKKRNENTQKLEKNLMTISISSNETLVKEFLDAYKQDEQDAEEVIETKSNGISFPQMIVFKNIKFSFSVKDKENATITVFYN